MVNRYAMQIKIKSSGVISGIVSLPSSKSICNRALAIGALAGCFEDISNLSDCDDTVVMANWLRSKPSTVNVGAAGTAMRFSTALLAVSDGKHVITGSERMQNRPISVLVDALRTLGAKIDYVRKEGFPPLSIEGCPGLCKSAVSLPGNVSSQYISALLMIGPTLRHGLTLSLTGKIVSKPYIDMTMSIMRQFGACVFWVEEDGQPLRIRVLPYAYKMRPYFVESDWSAASYWYEMVALAKNDDASVELPSLFSSSLQGDSCGAKVFDMLGVETLFEENKVLLKKKAITVDRLDYDFVNMPDLAQTFVVTCCMLGIPFHFTGLESLKIKETDRIIALKNELSKLGFNLEDRNDSELLWDGNKRIVSENELQSISIDTYEDHRMAMSFAPVAMVNGSVLINEPKVVSKSYPNYWNDLASVGFDISVSAE